MRAGLLYGSGSELEVAVAVVLRAAGFAVTDLGVVSVGCQDLPSWVNGEVPPEWLQFGLG